jgi:hypothetical protein
MSEFKFQTYALMCVRLAAECRGLAADAPEPDLRAHLLHTAACGRNSQINRVSCINA